MSDPADRLARNRWIALSLNRLVGVALVVIGIMVLSDEMALPRPVGWIALGMGLFATLVLPHLLIRRWRSPRP
jgi:hypothetical protein